MQMQSFSRHDRHDLSRTQLRDFFEAKDPALEKQIKLYSQHGQCLDQFRNLGDQKLSLNFIKQNPNLPGNYLMTHCVSLGYRLKQVVSELESGFEDYLRKEQKSLDVYIEPYILKYLNKQKKMESIINSIRNDINPSLRLSLLKFLQGISKAFWISSLRLLFVWAVFYNLFKDEWSQRFPSCAIFFLLTLAFEMLTTNKISQDWRTSWQLLFIFAALFYWRLWPVKSLNQNSNQTNSTQSSMQNQSGINFNQFEVWLI